MIDSAGDSGTNVQILIPQSESSLDNPVQLTCSVHASLLSFSPFGDIGYSLDNGPIHNMTDYTNQTIKYGADGNDWTCGLNSFTFLI